MLEFRRILEEESDKIKKLSDIVMNHLERKEFFIPFSEQVYKDMFDNDKVIAYGAFDGDKLVGTAQLFVAEDYIKEVKATLNINNSKIVDLGGYLVLPEYRNQGIVKQLQTILLDLAKEMDFDYIAITAHPENVPSNAAIKNLNAEFKKIFTTSNGYERNLYLLDLKNND